MSIVVEVFRSVRIGLVVGKIDIVAALFIQIIYTIGNVQRRVESEDDNQSPMYSVSVRVFIGVVWCVCVVEHENKKDQSINKT